MAIHLSFDLFPARWIGFALIRVPFIGSLSPTASVLWLLASVVACWYVALRLLANRSERTMTSSLGLLMFIVASRTEQRVWPALFVVLVAAWLASCVPNPQNHGPMVLRHCWQRMTHRPIL